MAPGDPTLTNALFLDYTVAGEEHTAMVRGQGGTTAADLMTALGDFITAVEGSFFDSAAVGARYREAGSSLTFPVVWTGPAAWGGVTGQHAASAWYIDWIGRSSGGRRVRLALFGPQQMQDLAGSDYRLPNTGDVGAGITALNAAASTLAAIDGEPVVWYTYANTGVNAYWRNKIR